MKTLLKTSQLWFLTSAVSLGALALLAACAQKYDIDEANYRVAQVTPNTKFGCDPFKSPDPQKNPEGPGISAKLYSDVPLLFNGSGPYPYNMGSVNVFFTREQGKEIYLQDKTVLFLPDLNVPERNFKDGFYTTDGKRVTSQKTGEVLTQYFALRMASQLRLAAGEDEGNYQLAMLADDGANVYLNNSTEPDMSVDGIHPPTLVCLDHTLTLKNGSLIPINIDYYQGPGFAISAVLLKRKRDPGQSLFDEKCIPANFNSLPQKQRDSYRVWEGSAGPKAPHRGEYSALLQRGWQPLKAGNFAPAVGAPKAPRECLP